MGYAIIRCIALLARRQFCAVFMEPAKNPMQENETSMGKVSENGENAGRGRLIALEGIDGSGKSTQAAYLCERLEKEGICCYRTMEPTDSPIGALIRKILRGEMKTDNRVIAGLFVADRLDHLLNAADGIAAKVEAGMTVVSDRYYFSSYAYNSVDMPMDWVIKANEPSSEILRPALNVFIDIEPDAALERIAKNRVRQELFETKARLELVRDNYRKAFRLLEEKERCVIIDGNRPEEEIAENVWEAVQDCIFEDSK